MTGVPSNVLIPWVGMEFDPSKAQSGSGEMPFAGLIIGQKTGDGSQGNVLDSTTYPCADQTGLTEKVTIDDGEEQTVTFGTCTTLAHVVAQMSAQLTGCKVTSYGGHVRITSNTKGNNSRVSIGTGTCALTWGTPVDGAYYEKNGIGDPNELKQVFKESEVSLNAGVGSMSHAMFKRWYKMNKSTDIYMILLDDAEGSTEGERIITIEGTATENGELPLYVNGTRIAVSVAEGDTAEEVADAFIDKWNEFDYLPYYPAGESGYVFDSTSYPVADQTGLTEKVTIDDGEEQTVTFGTCTTLAHVVAQMSAQLVDCKVESSGGHVKITSNTRGSDSSKVVIGTGSCALTWGTPVDGTTANNGGVLTLNSRNKGVAASDVDVRKCDEPSEKVPAGLRVTIGETISGAVDPDVQDAIDAINDQWCNVHANAYDDATNLGIVEDYLEEVYDPMIMKDAVSFHAKRGSVSDLTTFAETSGRNSHCVCLLDAGNRKMSTYELAALVAGACAKDAQEDPAVPLHRITLLGARPNSINERRIWTERNTLIQSGVSTLTDSNGLQTEGIVTMYLKNSSGASDTSYRYVVTKMILMLARWKFVNRINSRYPRAKLMNDATRVKAGQQIMTPDIGKAEAISWFKEMEYNGQFEGIEQFKTDLVCRRDDDNPNRLEWLLSPDLVNQFIVGSAVMQFVL